MCSIGRFVKDSCDKKSHTLEVGRQKIESFTDDDVNILSRRCGIPRNHELTDICPHHVEVYLRRYTRNQSKCCDPYSMHKKAVKKTLNEITLIQSIEGDAHGLKLIPGQKLCKRCKQRVNSLKETVPGDDVQSDNDHDQDDDDYVPQEEIEVPLESPRQELNKSLGELGVSPLSKHGIHSRNLAALGKRKIQKVQEAQGVRSQEVAAKVARVLNVTPEQLESFNKDAEYDRLMALVKEKITLTKDKREIVKFLTLTPLAWSVRKVAAEFHVSRYLVRKSRQLVRSKGILEMPDKYVGHGISEETKNIVTSFYEDDENSRSMPGAKDFVSIARNQHVQKRLLLCNVNELYVKFKSEHPDIKICRSTFASLRPKWCVTVTSSGSHSVCVCVYHQNVKLMLDACKFKTDQHTLTEKIVCNRQSRECMILRCENCPGTEPLRKHLLNEFAKLRPILDEADIGSSSSEDDEEEEEEQQVKFSQWVSTDRADIVKQRLPVSEFVDKLVDKLDTLTTHSFVASTQGAYVKKMRTELGDGEFLVLGDFAENHSFVVQDAAQSYHWNKKSCTLHPVMIYYRNVNTGVIEGCPIVYLSDDLKHDYYFVYKVIELAIHHIKTNLNMAIKKVLYVSDGCPNQYKNVYNFQSICYHERDFGIPCEWIFFATSHGKSPCDGLGGTAKRLTTRASLQRTIDNQITCAQEMFEFCTMEIQGIEFVFIKKEDMIMLRDDNSFLHKRFDPTNLYYLPGTKSFHHFTPLSTDEVGVKTVSTDTEFEFIFNFKTGQYRDENQVAVSHAQPTRNIGGGEYVVCRFEEKLRIGVVMSVDDPEKVAKVRFMHPPLPSNSLSWQSRIVEFDVPLLRILLEISPPIATTSSGRSYAVTQVDLQKIEALY